MSASTDLVRKCYQAYEDKDRAAIEAILADDFTFSSPLDDNIDRQKYFERCWPNSGNHVHFKIKHMTEADGRVFVTYTCERRDGTRFSNTESFTFNADGKIRHVDVFFGREENAPSHDESIRTVLDQMATACRNKDTKALSGLYAEDLIAFDLIELLQYHGAQKVLQRAEEWFTSFDGPISYDKQEVQIGAGETAAYWHCLDHVRGTRPDGNEINMWWRETACLRKIDGQWLITHMHSSEPFDMESGKALLGLRPS